MTEDCRGFAIESPTNSGTRLLALITEKLGSRVAVNLIASDGTPFKISRLDPSVAQRLGTERIAVTKQETLIIDGEETPLDTFYFFKPKGVVCAVRGTKGWKATNLEKSKLIGILSDAQSVNGKKS